MFEDLFDKMSKEMEFKKAESGTTFILTGLEDYKRERVEKTVSSGYVTISRPMIYMLPNIFESQSIEEGDQIIRIKDKILDKPLIIEDIKKTCTIENVDYIYEIYCKTEDVKQFGGRKPGGGV